jgi:MFS family permease
MTFAPVIFLFFTENGLSMTQILLLQSIYAIFTVILEIPTGTIGDYFGRKLSVSLGTFIFAFGIGIYSFGNSFTFFLVAELICALGGALISGSDMALIHSTLKSLKRDKEYKKIEGTTNSIRLTGMMLASLAGGLIGNFSLRLTLLVAGFMVFIAFLVSLTFKEPKLIVEKDKKESFNEIIVSSIKLIKNHNLLLWLIIFSSFMIGLGQIIHWYYQPYFLLVNISVAYFGFIYVVLELLSIVASRFTNEIETYFKGQKSLILLSLLLIIPTLFLGLFVHVFSILFFILHKIFFGIVGTILSDKVLKIIPSSKAATILSMGNLGRRFVYAMIGPIIGYLSDIYSLSYALIAFSIIVTVISIILFSFYKFIPEKMKA